MTGIFLRTLLSKRLHFSTAPMIASITGLLSIQQRRLFLLAAMFRIQWTSRTLLDLKKDCALVRFMGRKVPHPAKPPNLPPSKQTRYQVVHVPWMKPEDVKELLWRRHAYNHAVISIRELFKQELKAEADAGVGIEQLKKQELEEFNLILKHNDQENQKLAEKRRARERLESEQTRELLLDELESHLKMQEGFVAQRSKEVEQMIAESDSFVTLENLDEKLTEALENPVCHDFAIDLMGKRLTNPTPVKYLEGTPPRQKARIYDKTLGDIGNNRT